MLQITTFPSNEGHNSLATILGSQTMQPCRRLMTELAMLYQTYYYGKRFQSCERDKMAKCEHVANLLRWSVCEAIWMGNIEGLAMRKGSQMPGLSF